MVDVHRRVVPQEKFLSQRELTDEHQTSTGEYRYGLGYTWVSVFGFCFSPVFFFGSPSLVGVLGDSPHRLSG